VTEALWTGMQNTNNPTRNSNSNDNSGRARRLAHLTAAAVAAGAAFTAFGSPAQATESTCGTAQADDPSVDTFGGFLGGVTVAVGDVDAAAAPVTTTTTPISFGVEREMKESGEKGGTADINIGVGELQECTISKSMDSTSVQLAQFAINGNSAGAVDGADFNVWQQHYGQTAATGDFDADGDVDGRDFLVWQQSSSADQDHDKWIVIESMSSPIYR
jgi:hypothetical protein